jgi:transposase
MEATSDYWKGIYYLLEAHGFEVWLVNARDVKHLPGRPKTDTLDAVWLCKLAERQMLRPSFVPPPAIRQLRDVARYRADLVAARTAEKQRVEKLLEDAQIKLSVVASDIFGVSGRAMLAALVAGERDPKILAQLARTRLRAKLGPLVEAFTGFFTDQHAFLLAKMLARVDGLDADLAELDAKLAELIGPFAQAVDRLDEIPGVGQTAAHLLIAEIGVDMTRFPTAGHLVSWAKFAQASRSPPADARAADRPGTAIPTLVVCSARPPWLLGRPIPSLVNATGASLADAARNARSSRSAGPSWSSSGTCCPTRPYGSMTSVRASMTPASVQNAPSATTSASSKPSATRSLSNPPLDPAVTGTGATLIGSGSARILPHAYSPWIFGSG